MVTLSLSVHDAASFNRQENSMTTTAQPPSTQYDIATIMGGLYGDGIIGLKGAFTR